MAMYFVVRRPLFNRKISYRAAPKTPIEAHNRTGTPGPVPGPVPALPNAIASATPCYIMIEQDSKLRGAGPL
jgi:hypothetical protein